LLSIKASKEISLNVKTKASPESIVWDIKNKARYKFTAEEKIRIVLVALRGKESITDLFRREGIHPNSLLLYLLRY
jgi:transposase-like protein